MRYRTCAGLPLLSFTLLSGVAGAQGSANPASGGRRELVGIIRDARGVAIDGATVDVLGVSVRTDLKGAFRLFTPEIDTVTIGVRRPGYSPIEALISARNRQWDTVMVELEPTATRLSGVRIEEESFRRRETLKGFEERMKQKLGGLFITRSEIVQRNSLLLSDVLQTRRGVQIVRIGPRRNGVRFSTYTGRGSACGPDIWIDGQRARGMEIDDIPANTVEGLELYDSFATVPIQFSHSANTVPCGTIVIWTRQPGTQRP